MNFEVVYSATLEREYVRSQQRHPGQVDRGADALEIFARDVIASRMKRAQVWCTVNRLSAATGIPRQRVAVIVNQLVYAGLVERLLPPIRGASIHRGAAQHYRWMAS